MNKFYQREHLFITTKYFKKCHKFQIFGVRKSSINQFGLVNKGDKVFFLNKDDNLIIGPYEVRSDIFYNEEIIWEDKNGIDAYPYRVRLNSKIVYAIDGNIFSQIVEENNIRIDSGDLGQRSVFTFLPKDNGILENSLKQKGKEIKENIEEKKLRENQITLEFARNQGFTEAFLEFFLLKNFPYFFKNSDLLIYNQFRINLLGSKIDIIALSRKNILVIELKKDVIKKDDIDKFKTYVLWVKNNRRLLEEFFKIALNNTKIYSFIIGARIRQQGLLINNCDFSFKKYSFENQQIILSDI